MVNNSNDSKSKNKNFRNTSLAAGLLYLLTFVSIPTLALYSQVKSTNYVVSSGSDNAAIMGAILEVTIAVAGIATAVVLFPVLKKINQSAALGLVAARIVESASILASVAFILSIVSLKQSGAGAENLATSHALATLYDKLFLLSQSFIPAICDMLLGYMFYKSRLIPRGLALIGLVGGPMLLVGYFAILTGTIQQHGSLAGASAIGVALFEFTLGLWLLIKGFNAPALAKIES